MNRNATEKEQKVFLYLNDLRESGQTNMFGARPYIMKKFKMEGEEAKRHLMLWMKNFNDNGNYAEIEDENFTIATT